MFPNWWFVEIQTPNLWNFQRQAVVETGCLNAHSSDWLFRYLIYQIWIKMEPLSDRDAYCSDELSEPLRTLPARLAGTDQAFISQYVVLRRCV